MDRRPIVGVARSPLSLFLRYHPLWMRANRLKQKLASGKPAYGVWSAFGSPAVVEAIAQLEAYDWVLIDCEHGLGSADSCAPLLCSLAGGSATALVRVSSADPSIVSRVLDAGAEGVVIPKVRTAREVEELVGACRYPPVGTRGIGPLRASGYFVHARQYFEKANQEIAAIVQIETREAVEELDDILAVDGLDAIFIGPADLAAALGHFLDAEHEEVRTCVQEILDRAKKAGVPAGYYCSSGREARARVDQGFLMVNPAHDVAAMLSGLRREMRRVEEQE